MSKISRLAVNRAETPTAQLLGRTTTRILASSQSGVLRRMRHRGVSRQMTRYQIPEHVCASSDRDSVILLDIHEGKYYSLIGVGPLIFSALQEGKTIGEIVLSLERTFGDSPSKIQADVEVFLGNLVKRRLCSARYE